MSGGGFWRAGGPARGILLAILALLAGALATRDTLVQAFARGRPATALQLDPRSGTAIAMQFRRRLEASGEPVSRQELGDWAARASASLRKSALSAAMVRMIAIDPAQSDGAGRLALAERISRRDALTQLGLIETAVQSNDIGAALSHYDHALSIYPDLRSQLLPVLVGALDEPEIRQGIARLARQSRPWMNAFFASAVLGAKSPASIAALLYEVDHGPGAVPGVSIHEAALATRLVAEHDYANARRLAMRAAGKDAASIDRPGFSGPTWAASARPLTWAPGEIEGITASLEPDNTVVVTASGSAPSGIAFFRVLVLAPGTYRFSSIAAALPEDIAPVSGKWDFLCLHARSATITALAQMPVDAARLGSGSTMLTVPAECGAVRISFMVDSPRGSDAGLLLRDVALATAR